MATDDSSGDVPGVLRAWDGNTNPYTLDPSRVVRVYHMEHREEYVYITEGVVYVVRGNFSVPVHRWGDGLPVLVRWGDDRKG